MFLLYLPQVFELPIDNEADVGAVAGPGMWHKFQHLHQLVGFRLGGQEGFFVKGCNSSSLITSLLANPKRIRGKDATQRGVVATHNFGVPGTSRVV